jgi:hypothetical protein
MALEVPYWPTRECAIKGGAEQRWRMRAWCFAAEGSQRSTEAPLHEPPHVCLLMHVGAEQARTRLQERQRVCPAVAQVRDACDMMPAYPI